MEDFAAECFKDACDLLSDRAVSQQEIELPKELLVWAPSSVPTSFVRRCAAQAWFSRRESQEKCEIFSGFLHLNRMFRETRAYRQAIWNSNPMPSGARREKVTAMRSVAG